MLDKRGEHRQLRVLHAYNRHRNGGGADNVWDLTIRLSRERGLDVGVFCRDSNDIPSGLQGKIKAFTSGIYSKNAVKEFERALHEFKPDIVHAHELYPLISYWILPLCKKAGIPVVFYCYDYRLTCPIATHYSKGEVCRKCITGGEHWAFLRNCRNNRAESLAYAVRSAVARKFKLVTDNVDQFIAPSEFSRIWLIEELGVETARITTVPCAIPLPETAVDPANGEYIAFAGRFAEEKGVTLLIEAARRLDIPLKLAGFAASHPAVRPEDNIECVTTETPQELAEFYRGARMLVVPSTWSETFGIVAAESMSHGVPVIATRIGALQYTVDDEVTGLLFEKGNVADLSDKIMQLWTDPLLCRRLGQAAREKVQQEFTLDAHFRQTVLAYETALSARSYSR